MNTPRKDAFMGAASPPYTTLEEYLLSEASSDVKHEWCDGVMRKDGAWSCETGGAGASVTIRGATIGVDSVYE